MRLKEFEDLMQKNPNKIPVICEKAENCKIEGIKKTKYLLKKDLTIAQFSTLLKRKLQLDSSNALFLLARGKNTLSSNDTIAQVYDKYKDEDGFLYIYYSNQEVWGS